MVRDEFLRDLFPTLQEIKAEGKAIPYMCGALQLCLLYLDETTGASAEAWVEFNKKACLL